MITAGDGTSAIEPAKIGLVYLAVLMKSSMAFCVLGPSYVTG